MKECIFKKNHNCILIYYKTNNSEIIFPFLNFQNYFLFFYSQWLAVSHCYLPSLVPFQSQPNHLTAHTKMETLGTEIKPTIKDKANVVTSCTFNFASYPF